MSGIELTPGIIELCRLVWTHGHADGWRGNQLRRNTGDVDAAEGWKNYVKNGALATLATRINPERGA